MIPPAPNHFQSWIPTQRHIYSDAKDQGFSWIQLDEKNRDGFFKVFCYFEHDVFWPVTSTEHLIKCLPLSNHAHIFRGQIRVQTTKRGMPQKLFFSCESSFLHQRLEDFCSKTETQNGNLRKYHQIATSSKHQKNMKNYLKQLIFEGRNLSLSVFYWILWHFCCPPGKIRDHRHRPSAFSGPSNRHAHPC